MTARSERHHEVPQWLFKHFCWDHGKMLWMGFKDTREIRSVSLRDAFVRNDANMRTDYQSRGDGRFQQVKSDLDEEILANFDGQAASAARELIDFSRQWRDEGPVAPRLSPEKVEVGKRTIVAQARRTRESQARVGLSENKFELYLDVVFKLAEEVGQQMPSREGLLQIPGVTEVFDFISQNLRAIGVNQRRPRRRPRRHPSRHLSSAPRLSNRTCPAVHRLRARPVSGRRARRCASWSPPGRSRS